MRRREDNSELARVPLDELLTFDPACSQVLNMKAFVRSFSVQHIKLFTAHRYEFKRLYLSKCVLSVWVTLIMPL